MQKSQLKGSSNSKYLDSFTIQNHRRDIPPRHFKNVYKKPPTPFPSQARLHPKLASRTCVSDTWPPLDIFDYHSGIDSKRVDQKRRRIRKNLYKNKFNPTPKSSKKNTTHYLTFLLLRIPTNPPFPSSPTVRNATLHKKKSLHPLPLPTPFLSPPGSHGSHVTLLHSLSRRIQQAMHITGHAAPPRRRRTPINPLESKSGTRQLPTGFSPGTRRISGHRAICTASSSRRRWKRRCDLPAAAVGGTGEFVGGEGVAQLFVAGCGCAADGRAVWT